MAPIATLKTNPTPELIREQANNVDYMANHGMALNV